MSERGVLLIISSPSGAGKTTLARRLLGEFEEANFSVSYTTRKPRVNEQDGVDYHFVDDDRFAAMAEAGEFAERAVLHGNSYGTSRVVVEAASLKKRSLLKPHRILRRCFLTSSLSMRMMRMTIPSVLIQREV